MASTVSSNKYENNHNDFEKSVKQLNQKITNPEEDSLMGDKKVVKKSNNKTTNKIIYRMCLVFFGIYALGIIFIHWYYVFPIILIWWVWRKVKLNNKIKSVIICFIVIILMSAVSYFSYSDRVATIEILSPEDGFSVQSDKALIRGTIDPSTAKIKINDIFIPVNNGSFEYEASLPNEENTFIIYAINKRRS
jgi:hypothetical protein